MVARNTIHQAHLSLAAGASAGAPIGAPVFTSFGATPVLPFLPFVFNEIEASNSDTEEKERRGKPNVKYRTLSTTRVILLRMCEPAERSTIVVGIQPPFFSCPFLLDYFSRPEGCPAEKAYVTFCPQLWSVGGTLRVAASVESSPITAGW